VLQGSCVRGPCEKGQFGHEHESKIYVMSGASQSEQYGLDERRNGVEFLAEAKFSLYTSVCVTHKFRPGQSLVLRATQVSSSRVIEMTRTELPRPYALHFMLFLILTTCFIYLFIFGFTFFEPVDRFYETLMEGINSRAFR
jgi:hypothetical protein